VTAPASSAETKGAPVEIDGRPIFLVQTSVGGLSPEAREKILNIAERNDIRKKMKREALRLSLTMLID
jgi:hypothetical protein